MHEEQRPLRILIVEDEALLALQLEDDLLDAGHDVVGSAMTSSDAVAIARAARPELALVDVHLADGPTGVGVGRALVAEGVPVVFMTANVKRIPEDFAGAVGVIPKPYTLSGFRRAIQFLQAALGPGALPPPPSSLHLAPHIKTDDTPIRFT